MEPCIFSTHLILELWRYADLSLLISLWRDVVGFIASPARTRTPSFLRRLVQSVYRARGN
jgi:hypothetical protein